MSTSNLTRHASPDSGTDGNTAAQSRAHSTAQGQTESGKVGSGHAPVPKPALFHCSSPTVLHLVRETWVRISPLAPHHHVPVDLPQLPAHPTSASLHFLWKEMSSQTTEVTAQGQVCEVPLPQHLIITFSNIQQSWKNFTANAHVHARWKSMISVLLYLLDYLPTPSTHQSIHQPIWFWNAHASNLQVSLHCHARGCPEKFQP